MLPRPVQPADFPAIAELTNHYILRTSIHFGYEPVTADELRGAWEKSRERYPYLVLDADAAMATHPKSVASDPGPDGPPVSHIAGYAKAGVWRDRAAYSWVAELGVYVHPAFHRLGVGKTLYRTIIDLARLQGFHTLIGGITLPNDASVRLHESVGFTPVGTYRRVGWKFDRWHDAGFWELPLRDAAHRASPLRTPDECWAEFMAGRPRTDNH